MGLFDGLFGGGGSSTSETKTKLPAFVEQGVEQGIRPFFENPTYTAAPWNENMHAAGNMFQNNANAASQYNFLGDYQQRIGAMDPFIGRDMTADFMGQMGRGSEATGRAGDYATISGQAALALGNPFRQDMIDSTERQADRAYQRAATDIAGRAATGSSFGGSGEAIAMANLGIDRENRARDSASQIGYDSYAQGANLASQNMQSENAAISRQVQTMLQSLGLDMSALTGVQGAQNDFYNRNQNALNFDLGLVDSTQDAFNQQQRRMAETGGMLYDFGSNWQNQQQKVADQPYTQFSRLAGLIPQTQQTTTPTNNTGMLGSALTLGSLFGGF